MIVGEDGTKRWFNEDGQLHCRDGPAIIHPDGSEMWYQNGQLHREDGPAVIWEDGEKEWWIEGKRYSFQEWTDRENSRLYENRENQPKRYCDMTFLQKIRDMFVMDSNLACLSWVTVFSVYIKGVNMPLSVRIEFSGHLWGYHEDFNKYISIRNQDFLSSVASDGILIENEWYPPHRIERILISSVQQVKRDVLG